jgi:hypothetical protein
MSPYDKEAVMATQEMKAPEQRIISCGDISCEFLIDPIPRPTLDPISVTYRPRKREIILVDTEKPNSLAVLDITQKLLREAGIAVQDAIRTPKSNASVPFSPDELDEFAAEEGLVVYGVND